MLKDFQEHIEANFANLKQEQLLVAISGGLDSVVLTKLLVSLGYTLQLAHCNFKLRAKEADLDEQFVLDWGASLGLRVHTKSFDTLKYAKDQKISIQMAARNLRYSWFDKLLKQHKLNSLLTAHHLDDSIETFMINLTRGTGLDGLTGIAAVNGSLIRPLLPFSRKQIESYARAQGLRWREDSSNQDDKYLRNKIRQRIVPVLKEMNPGFTGAFSQTLEHLGQSQKLIDETLTRLKSELFIQNDDGSIKITLETLRSFKDPAPYLYQLLKPYHFTDWRAMAELLAAQSGKYLLSTTHRLVKDRDHLLLDQIPTESKGLYHLVEGPNTTIKTEAFTLSLTLVDQSKENSKNILYVDAERLAFPLILRQHKPGDLFYPLGLGGRKKVSKYFKDEKFSLIDKERTWLLSSNDEIVCILGHRMDERFKLTEKTQKILRIAISK